MISAPLKRLYIMCNEIYDRKYEMEYEKYMSIYTKYTGLFGYLDATILMLFDATNINDVKKTFETINRKRIKEFRNSDSNEDDDEYEYTETDEYEEIEEEDAPEPILRHRKIKCRKDSKISPVYMYETNKGNIVVGYDYAYKFGKDKPSEIADSSIYDIYEYDFKIKIIPEDNVITFSFKNKRYYIDIKNESFFMFCKADYIDITDFTDCKEQDIPNIKQNFVKKYSKTNNLNLIVTEAFNENDEKYQFVFYNDTLDYDIIHDNHCHRIYAAAL